MLHHPAEGVLYAGSLVTYYCHTDVGRLCFHSYKLTRCFSCIPSFLLHYLILELLITSCQLPCLPISFQLLSRTCVVLSRSTSSCAQPVCERGGWKTKKGPSISAVPRLNHFHMYFGREGPARNELRPIQHCFFVGSVQLVHASLAPCMATFLQLAYSHTINILHSSLTRVSKISCLVKTTQLLHKRVDQVVPQ